MEEFEGADWVLISDEAPVDEHRRDELLEPSRFTCTPDSATDEDEATPTPTTSSSQTTRRRAGVTRRPATDCLPPLSSAGALLHRRHVSGRPCRHLVYFCTADRFVLAPGTELPRSRLSC